MNLASIDSSFKPPGDQQLAFRGKARRRPDNRRDNGAADVTDPRSMTAKACMEPKIEESGSRMCVLDSQSYNVGAQMPSIEFCKTCTCGSDLDLICEEVASCNIPVVSFQNILLGHEPLSSKDADFLIRDAKSWETLRSELGQTLKLPEVGIDFSREFVVGTIRTLINAASNKVLVKSIAVVDGQIVINLVTQGPNCDEAPSNQRS